MYIPVLPSTASKHHENSSTGINETKKKKKKVTEEGKYTPYKNTSILKKKMTNERTNVDVTFALKGYNMHSHKMSVDDKTDRSLSSLFTLASTKR